MTTIIVTALIAAVLGLLARNARLLIHARRADDRASDWMARAVRAENEFASERVMAEGLRRMLLAEIKLHARPTDAQFLEFTRADVRPLVDDGGAR